MAGRPTTPLTEPDLWASHPALWNEFFMVKQRKLTRDQLLRGGGACRGHGLRYMQQVRSSSGFVPFSAALAPFRAVGEHKGQLARLHSSHSISPLAPPAFTGFIATMRRSDFFSGMASLSLPPSTLPLSWTRKDLPG